MMYNGDTALVGVQYSYLPSWISFLGDRQKSMESGRLMIDTIHDRWQQLPPDRRPKLVLYGESLGSMAGQGAFGWLPDIARMGFDSVLWVGPPNASPLWQGLTVRRDPGTPEVEPRYDNGRTVRFSQATDAAEIAADAAPPWEGTRVLFLQHPSDPIVWWSPDLLFSRPDWLVEPPGRDRTASMRWYPIVTFWQVSADMTNAAGVPGGHGHNYGDSVLDGWAAVAPPDGWTADDTERIRVALDKSASDRRPRILVRAKRIRQIQAVALAAALVGWSGLVPRIPPRWHPLPHAILGTALVAVTRAPLGLRPPALWSGLRLGLAAAAPVAVGVAATTALPPVRGAMADRKLPAPMARWLLLRIPLGTVWSEEAAFRAALGTVGADAFGPRRWPTAAGGGVRALAHRRCAQHR